jgi:hypothetical protein
MCLFALIGGLALLGSTAQASRGHVFGSTFGESGAGNGQLDNPTGLAINEASGDVYVVDESNDRVERFGSSGVYIDQFNGSGLLANEGTAAPSGQFASPNAIAVDNSSGIADPSSGDAYVVDSGHHVVDKYSPEGKYLGQIPGTTEGAFGELIGVATDAAGRVWVYQGSGEIDGFSNAADNEFLSKRTSGASGFAEPGFAADSNDDFYATHSFSKFVAKLADDGEVLDEQVGSEEATGVADELSSDDVYIATATGVGRFDATGASIETFGAEQLAGASAVGVDAARETVYVADAAKNVIDVFRPEPTSTPKVESESVINVTAESVDLEAEVNPHGESSEYYFEYGRCTSPSACASSPYEATLPSPAGSLGAAFGNQPVSVHSQGLSAGDLYHFRVVAHNALSGPEGTLGKEETFTTQSVGAKFALPDGRMWEMVSPTDKDGALLETIGEGQVTQASANGSAMTYVASGPTEGAAQGTSNKIQVLSTRGPRGWESRDIAPPHTRATGLSEAAGQEYRYFSEDLSSAIVQPFGNFIPVTSPQALSPAEASEQTAFLRTDYLGGNYSSPCVTSCYQPLVTGAPGYANVPENTVFGQTGQGGGACPPETFCGPQFRGATPDLSHVILESRTALTSTTLKDTGLYEWSGGKLKLVSMLRDNSAAGNRPMLGNIGRNARNAISAHGSRIVWAEHEGEEHVYLRDTSTEETVQLDEVQPGVNGVNPPKAAFQFASRDGSKVFFTDGEHLTAHSGGGPSASFKEDDLYECEMKTVGGELTCKLEDLTPVHAGESADVLDEVLGASEDGSYVYFVANGKLTEEGNANGEHAVHGTCAGLESKAGAVCNLYVDHYNGSEWQTKFVALLSAEDFPDWNGDASANLLANMTSRVSSNGQWLAFMSERDLSGNDTRDASTGQPDEQVYLYDAVTGRIACPSCDPTGARPVGVEYQSLRYGLDGLQVWPGNRRLAASVPAWTAYTATGQALYQSRYLSNSGRMFFNSGDALVPQDSNDTGDVYEYEPPGIPKGTPYTCSTASSTYSERTGGCVDLISAGESNEESGFLDASENGEDVFFLTASQLTSEDGDTSMDVYDAHECNSSCVVPTASQSQSCTGEDCRPPAAAPPTIFQAPSSSTFLGPGNPAPAIISKPKPLTRAQKLSKALKACKKRPRRKRAACVRQAEHEYGPVHKANARSKGAK